MRVITSKSGKTDVLLGTIPNSLYFRGDGGAFVNKQFGSDLSNAYMDDSFVEAIVAHKLEIVLVMPQRPGYQAERPLTMGDFYNCELFREVWMIPVKAWIRDPKTKEYGEADNMPPIVSHFLMRGRSIDEFGRLLQPFEEQAFVQWVANKKELTKKFKEPAEFAKHYMMESMFSSIYTAEVQKDTGVKDYYYIEWSTLEPSIEYEKELLEIAKAIGKDYNLSLINSAVEKGAQKAAEQLALNGALPGSNAVALPGGK